ncbi:hypothetical protein BWU74_30910 [Paraburkholderia caledonica]|nr:hypothetical protein BWU74_30910 [Burkholderia sp. Bk]
MHSCRFDDHCGVLNCALTLDRPRVSDRCVLLRVLGLLRDQDTLVHHPLAGRKAVPFDNALDFDFVSLSRPTSLAERLALATAPPRLELRVQIRSFDAICRMVATGLGVAVLSDIAERPHLRSMALCRILLTLASLSDTSGQQLKAIVFVLLAKS